VDSFDIGAIARFATSANSTRYRCREPPVRHRLLDGLRDAEFAPQPIEQPRPADRAGIADLQRPAAGGQPRLTHPRGLLGAVPEMRPDRRGQPPQPVHVDRLDPAQVHQHLRPGRPVDTTVVRQRDVTHHRTVGVPPLREPQVHAHTKPRRPR